MFKRILLATDGSSHAEKALEYARDLALRDDAQMIVVHAFEPVPTYHSYQKALWGIRSWRVTLLRGKRWPTRRRRNCKRLA